MHRPAQRIRNRLPLLRTLGTAGRLAVVLALLGGVIAACGSSAPRDAAAHRCGKRWLTVYSDLPLHGADSADMLSLYRGEYLALHRAGKRAGGCNIQLESFNDANASTGAWDPGLTAQVAHTAASAQSAIAYIGDFDSGATATSLQITNASNTLQISPWSPYVGFTGSSPADDRGDPQRYQLSGHNTFARLVPSDYNQAQATVTFMAEEGVTRLYVLDDYADPFDGDIASLIANAAPSAGVYLVGENQLLDLGNSQPQGYAGVAHSIAATRADAVVVAGDSGPGALALWTELHAVLPHARLFAPSTLATPQFLSHLGAATSSTFVTSPVLQWDQYPRLASTVYHAYERHWHSPPTKFVLYGYDAMDDVLAAVRAAAKRGGPTDPAALLDAFFHHLGHIAGSIGDYIIYPDGNTSLTTFDGYQDSPGGVLVRLQTISVG
jgi:branched-chain amino acid transport system substrate-binding protein